MSDRLYRMETCGIMEGLPNEFSAQHCGACRLVEVVPDFIEIAVPASMDEGAEIITVVELRRRYANQRKSLKSLREKEADDE